MKSERISLVSFLTGTPYEELAEMKTEEFERRFKSLLKEEHIYSNEERTAIMKLFHITPYYKYMEGIISDEVIEDVILGKIGQSFGRNYFVRNNKYFYGTEEEFANMKSGDFIFIKNTSTRKVYSHSIMYFDKEEDKKIGIIAGKRGDTLHYFGIDDNLISIIFDCLYEQYGLFSNIIVSSPEKISKNHIMVSIKEPRYKPFDGCCSEYKWRLDEKNRLVTIKTQEVPFLKENIFNENYEGLIEDICEEYSLYKIMEEEDQLDKSFLENQNVKQANTLIQSKSFSIFLEDLKKMHKIFKGRVLDEEYNYETETNWINNLGNQNWEEINW